MRAWMVLALSAAAIFLPMTVGLAQGTEQTLAKMDRKMAAIRIPSIEFRSTTLADAVEFLRQESRRLDPASDPQDRGVNILLQIAGSPAADTRITLNLTNIPLMEALRYVARQAGLQVRIEPYAVSLVPPGGAGDPMITATFNVQPTFFGTKPADADAAKP